MKEWHRISYDETLVDGTTKKIYRLILETDSKELLYQIENYFYMIMDQEEKDAESR